MICYLGKIHIIAILYIENWSSLRARLYYGIEEARQAIKAFAEETAGSIIDAKISISGLKAEVYSPENNAMLYWKIEKNDEVEMKKDEQ